MSNNLYDPGHPGPYQPPVPPLPPPRRRRTGRVVLIVAAVLAASVIGMVACTAAVLTAPVDVSGIPSPDPVRPTPTIPPATSGTVPSPAALPAGRVPMDGTLLVPDDVAPGTYRARAPEAYDGDANCYWARLRSTDGGVDAIIDNDLVTTVGGVVTLTVRASDAAIEVRGCGTWRKIK